MNDLQKLARETAQKLPVPMLPDRTEDCASFILAALKQAVEEVTGACERGLCKGAALMAGTVLRKRDEQQPRGEPWTDLLELAWGIIANAAGGDWDKESREWQDAATRWRDSYFGSLSKVSKKSSEQPNASRAHNASIEAPTEPATQEVREPITIRTDKQYLEKLARETVLRSAHKFYDAHAIRLSYYCLSEFRKDFAVAMTNEVLAALEQAVFNAESR